MFNWKIIGISTFSLLATFYTHRSEAENADTLQSPWIFEESLSRSMNDFLKSSVLKPENGLRSFDLKLKKNATFYTTVKSLGFSSSEIGRLVKTARPHMNLSRLRPGTLFTANWSLAPLNRVTSLEYRLEPTKKLHLKRDVEGEWTAEIETLESRTQILSYSGRVDDSLWASATFAGMAPELIGEMAAIFAWQVDFAREVQKGDSWRLLVEQELVENEAVAWGDILVAEYRTAKETFSGSLLREAETEKNLGYFGPDGKSLRRMFLKAPIKFGRISSRFSHRRFHPILKKHRPHLGVDYAAKRGTPVMAVGDGVVVRASNMGGAGKTIKLRHNSMYQTHYKHLSGFRRGVRRGAKVKQGDVIGYVGSTGLSTGPHLHFELWENGRYVDPLGKKFPSADPVPGDLLKDFQARAQFWLGLLPEWVDENGEAPRGPLYVMIESP
jgi:murein DD-endopeptidase MepM/ murein hydrolase activator NlpD